MRVSKRLLSLTLVLVLILALAPVMAPTTVSAALNNPKTIAWVKSNFSSYPGNPVGTEAQLRTALLSVDPGQYIQLNGNISLNSELQFTGNYSIAIIGNGIGDFPTRITLAQDKFVRHLKVNAPGAAAITFADIELAGMDGPISGGITTVNDLTLDGLIIRDCAAESNGGAIWAGGTTGVTLINCTLENNRTINQNNTHGGAVYAGDVEARDSVIKNNRTTTPGSVGGGIYAVRSLTLSGVTMEENTSNYGAAAYCEKNISVTSSKIDNNSAVADGGGLFSRDASVTVGGASVISNNKATDGAGIYAAANVTINGNSKIEKNAAGIAVAPGVSGVLGDGGGVHAKTGNVTLNDNAIVISNTATDRKSVV